MPNQDIIRSSLFGLAVGDALGVPVEFKSREWLRKHPVTDMTGFGTYNQPPGTWSDDSSLAFCLAEALTVEFNINAIGDNFVKWMCFNYWTPHGDVFDIGIATLKAIERISQGIQPDLAGGTGEGDNGNGSLMRILPLLFYIQDKPVNERFDITRQVSSITHGHIRSVMACFYYLEYARLLVLGIDKFEAYHRLQKEFPEFMGVLRIDPAETVLFSRLLTDSIHENPDSSIDSSGYVLHTLEASVWCLLNTDNYKDAVLKAVNLGGDTDTTGAVTGGLAGLLYGIDGIYERWLEMISRRGDIEKLAERMGERIFGSY